MTLPKTLTTVTPFSKYLAMLLFVLFPVVAFCIGTAYGKSLIDTLESKHKPTHVTRVLLDNSYVNGMVFQQLKSKPLSAYNSTNTYSLPELKSFILPDFSFTYPSDYKILSSNDNGVTLQKKDIWTFNNVKTPVEATIAITMFSGPPYEFENLNQFLIQKSLDSFIFNGKLDEALMKSSVSTSTIGQEKALYIEYPGAAGYPSVEILVLHLDKAFSLRANGNSIDGLAETFQTIVSSFTFKN